MAILSHNDITPDGRRIFYGTATPVFASDGQYFVGDILMNSAPGNAGPWAWACVTSGSPGNWTAYGISARRGGPIASAATIAPGSTMHHITGTAAIVNITVPAQFPDGGSIVLVPDGVWTWTAAGNIAITGTAVVNVAVQFTWDAGTALWYPSYR